ncbi:MAG: hypothetical protein V9E96_03440 [Chitinophagaceae bacterium]
MVLNLGLFDDATAMTKFQAWHEEHEANVKRRNDSHRTQQRQRRAYVPPVRKVEEAPVAAPTPVAEETPAAEGTTEA